MKIEELQELRMDRNLTQGQVAEKMGISVRQYQRYETEPDALASIKLDMAAKLADTLGMYVDELASLVSPEPRLKCCNYGEMERIAWLCNRAMADLENGKVLDQTDNDFDPAEYEPGIEVYDTYSEACAARKNDPDAEGGDGDLVPSYLRKLLYDTPYRGLYEAVQEMVIDRVNKLIPRAFFLEWYEKPEDFLQDSVHSLLLNAVVGLVIHRLLREIPDNPIPWQLGHKITTQFVYWQNGYGVVWSTHNIMRCFMRID